MCSPEAVMEEHEKGREAFETEEAYRLHCLRHSTAHVMAQAIMKLYPTARLAIGPAIEDDFAAIEEEMRRVVRENQPFEHEDWSREKATAFFAERNQGFKLELIDSF